MQLKLKILLPIIVVLLILIPLSVYSAIENATIANNSSLVDNNNLSVMNNNNLSQNNTKLLDVPDVRQPSDYSCGPTSLQAVLGYYGMDMKVDDLINMTNCTPENGTLPENLAQTARNLGFNAEIKQNLTLEDLQQYINQGIPVIIDGQAWKSNNTTALNWTDNTADGHYMVVIGIDNENVYLEDPAILGSRGYMTNEEFLTRWHDLYQDPDNNGTNITTTHLGIIITGKEPPARQLIIKID
jgi:predicted double-glycine peptidase